MRVVVIVVAALLALGLLGVADRGVEAGGGKPGKGFWKVLVKPHAKWVLTDNVAAHVDHVIETLTIETYDVRKIDGADVARLRWTHGDNKEALLGTHAGPLTQVAVTSAGLYLLTADMDDEAVAAALKKKPSRSDPPKAYKPSKLNEGRYLEIHDDKVCMGQGPTPGAPECEDTCDGQVCITATDGIVELSGNWAPGDSEFLKL